MSGAAVKAHTAEQHQVPQTLFRRLGTLHYEDCYRQMRDYVAQRSADDADEVWFLQHHPVFTLGRAASSAHILNPGEIPVVQTDRGGEVTYHGPGQLVAYTMLDVRRRGLGVSSLVRELLLWLQRILAHYQVESELRPGQPGVYVGGAKIASVGMRVGRRCSYHGISFNVDMDLSPFAGINPCGYAGLQVTSLRELGVAAGVDEVAAIAEAEFPQ